MKDNVSLKIIEFISIVICLIAIGIFTYVFRLEKSDLRYLFLVLDVFIVYNLYKILNSLSFNKKNNIRITKNSNNMIMAKYLKKISI